MRDQGPTSSRTLQRKMATTYHYGVSAYTVAKYPRLRNQAFRDHILGQLQQARRTHGRALKVDALITSFHDLFGWGMSRSSAFYQFNVLHRDEKITRTSPGYYRIGPRAATSRWTPPRPFKKLRALDVFTLEDPSDELDVFTLEDPSDELDDAQKLANAYEAELDGDIDPFS